MPLDVVGVPGGRKFALYAAGCFSVIQHSSSHGAHSGLGLLSDIRRVAGTFCWRRRGSNGSRSELNVGNCIKIR